MPSSGRLQFLLQNVPFWPGESFFLYSLSCPETRQFGENMLLIKTAEPHLNNKGITLSITNYLCIMILDNVLIFCPKILQFQILKLFKKTKIKIFHFQFVRVVSQTFQLKLSLRTILTSLLLPMYKLVLGKFFTIRIRV